MKLLYCHLVVVFLCVWISASNAQCVDPGNKTVTLPVFNPSLYHYGIEITAEDMNETIFIDSYYSSDEQRSFYYFYLNNEMTKYSLDYQNNQSFVETDECKVKDLYTKQNDESLFGMGIENGPLNLTQLFYLNKAQNGTDMGKEMMDGIEVNHYHACIFCNETNTTSNIDIYYRSNSLKLNDQTTPFRLVLNYTQVASKSPTKVYVYRFFNIEKEVLDWWPNLPFNKVCPGRKDTPSKPVPPNKFTMKSEIRSPELNAFELEEGWYDYSNKIYKERVNNDVAIIHDFHQGVRYKMSKTTGNCSITSLELDPFYDIAPIIIKNRTLFMLRRPLAFLNQFNLTYGGNGMRNGVDTDVWICPEPAVMKEKLFDGEKAVIYTTYFYTRASNGPQKIVGVETLYIAVINSTYSENITFSSNIFEYAESFDSQSAYDVSSCYNDSMKETFILKFSSDNYQSILKNPNNFKKNILNIVAQHANVSFNRVQTSINYGLADTVGSNGQTTTFFYVWITLLGVAPAKGNSVELQPQVNLTIAVSNLQAILGDNRFTISFFAVEINQTLTMTAFPSYFKSQSELLSPPESPQPPTQDHGLSTGVVAGIAVAMLIAGVMIGVFVMIWRAKTNRGNYAYTMQD